MRILTPTENKRLNEMIGFVGLSCAVLLTLSLLSYSPLDPSFNTSGPSAGIGVTRNWIGPVGAHMADAMFQVFGYAAFLVPIGMFVIAMRWFRSQLLEAPITKLVGGTVLIAAFSSELSLMHMWDVRGKLPPGGLLGTLLAEGLRAAFAPLGANLIAVATVLTALFLTTSFSLSKAGTWLKKPLAEDGVVGQWMARMKDWRDEKESKQLKKRVAEIKIAGRPAVAEQRVSKKESVSAVAELDEEEEDDDAPLKSSSRVPAIIKFRDEEPAAKKKLPEPPKVSIGRTNYKLPPTSLLGVAERGEKMDEDELKDRARAIEQKCLEFDIGGHVTQINPGPVVTTFEFKPEAGIKYSRIQGLGDDLCMALQAESILIERIPGKSTVGIEVPNVKRETIALRDVIESPEFSHSPSKLTLAFGKDLTGRIRAGDLTQMPHLLIAGSTGTGKSVFINSLLMSLLYKATPDELKLVLIDPKQLELGLYADIPHLFTPVVTDAKVAANVMRNAVREMERRLKLLAARGSRNIDQYNRTFEKGQSLSLFDGTDAGDEHKPPSLPRDHHRRARRPDDGRYQRRGRIHHASCANGARRGHSLDSRHAAPFRGRDHRPHQSQLPRAHQFPRRQQSGLAHDSRRQRLGIAARPRRHAVFARRLVALASRARPVCDRARSGRRLRILARAGQGRLQRRNAQAAQR